MLLFLGLAVKVIYSAPIKQITNVVVGEFDKLKLHVEKTDERVY